jgi:hypothetical protein
MCDLTRSIDRMQAADFTKAYNAVPLTFITLKPELKSRNWITIRPFSKYVWFMIGFSFIITTILIQVLYSKVEFTYNPIDSISISLIGALLQQCKYQISIEAAFIKYSNKLIFRPLLLLTSLCTHPLNIVAYAFVRHFRNPFPRPMHTYLVNAVKAKF